MKIRSTFHRTLAVLCATAALAACDDDTTSSVTAMLSADAMTLEFGTLDANFGAGLAQTVTVSNTGGTGAAVSPAIIEGAAAADFTILETPGSLTLGAGSTTALRVAFDPTTAGSRSATLRLPVEGGDDVTVALTGTGQQTAYVQVDRMGIPALNTVFNHPPQFSKTAYNVAKPDEDVATYTGLFETVLGAVANPDPAATAALLLPDALPVSLSGPTAFASLTGRALSDDAVDVALSVVVGPSSLHSDNVDSNDRTFLSTFPYLATPNN